MKKFLKVLLVIVLILVAGFLIIGLVEPKDVTLQRSMLIKAPKEKVYEQMTHFSQWHNWSPWAEKDSTIKITLGGTEGQPGATYHWVGDKDKTGEGTMTITSVTPADMTYDMEFLKPWKQKAKGFVHVSDTTNGMVNATWGFTAHYPYPWNGFLLFVNMDKMLGGDFDRGLELLKKHVEAEAPLNPAPAPDSASMVPAHK